MARRLLSCDEFRKALKVKRVGREDAVRMEHAGSIIKAADGSIDIVVSTEAVDRSKDVVLQDGWKLSNFSKNPVVLFAHNSYDLPVGRSPRMAIETNPGRLVARGVEFVPREIDAFAGTVGDMVKGGWLNAASVGFLPLKYAFNDERGDYAIDFLEQELLEFSIVPIPANPEALVGAKSAGIDIGPMVDWASKLLDTKTARCRGELEEFYKLAKPLVTRGRNAPKPVVRDDGDGDEDDKTQTCDCPDGALVKCEHCSGYTRMAAPDADGDDDGDKAFADPKILREVLQGLKNEIGGLRAKLEQLNFRTETMEKGRCLLHDENSAPPNSDDAEKLATFIAEETRKQVSLLLGRVD